MKANRDAHELRKRQAGLLPPTKPTPKADKGKEREDTTYVVVPAGNPCGAQHNEPGGSAIRAPEKSTGKRTRSETGQEASEGSDEEADEVTDAGPARGKKSKVP